MGFTYEETNREEVLETYEWDRTWWEHAPDATKPRVLLIGDSISAGYGEVINKLFGGEIYADGFRTSKALDNPYLLPSIELFLKQSTRCDMLHVNNGLHGWHLDAQAYETHYRNFILGLKKLCPDVPIVLALTTPARVREDVSQLNPLRTPTINERNAIVQKLAKEFDLEVNDLHSVIIDHPEWYRDGVHQVPEGYMALAEQVATVVRKYLK